MHDLFSADGIAAWRRHLDETDAFRRAAGSWRGTMLLVEAGDGPTPERMTWLRVGEGQILEARPGVSEDHAAAEFVLSAAAHTWQALTTGRRELIATAMQGDLRLVAGSVFRLLPHAGAASALLKAAAQPTG